MAAEGEGRPGRLLVGTSGYSYSDWQGVLYPAGTPLSEYLQLYAREFPLVELNFSYYTRPDPGTLERMVARTPDGFLFTIKAHQSLTHDRSGDLGAEARRFQEGIAPLAQAGRLAAVLFQFPYSFHYTPEARRYLEALCGAFEALPKAVEFRGAEWQKDSVYEGLARRGAAFVNVDVPGLERLPAASEAVTGELAYVRFHGRNRANWWSGTNVTRYDYLYGPAELGDWLPRLQRMLLRSRLLLAVFNNHSRGQAVRNARDLLALLGRGGQPGGLATMSPLRHW